MQASATVTATGDSKAAIGEALKAALSGNRLQSISLHDERGDVLWLDEGALGPDEHNLVVEASTSLTTANDRAYVFQNIGDGRAAAFLPARSPLNDLVGIAMIIADAKFLDSKGAAKFVTQTTTNLMRRLAFLRRPATLPPAVVPPPSASAATPAKVVSPPAPARTAVPAKPAIPPVAARPVAPTAPAAPARPAPPAAQRPAPPPAKPALAPARPAAPVAKAPPAPFKPAPQAKPAEPAARAGATSAKPTALEELQRPDTSQTDSIAFEISDIDPASLIKPSARPDLRVVQSDRLPKLDLSADGIADAVLADEPMYATPPGELAATPAVTADDATMEVGTLSAEPVSSAVALAEAELAAEVPRPSSGAGQFEFYGQIFELHVQQLVKLRAGGGTRRYEVLVRDAHADNEFGSAPERVIADVHDPSANSDLDRIVVEQLVTWLGEHHEAWEAQPSTFSVNVGMGTIADPKFASYVANVLKKHKVPSKVLGFEITEKSCIDQVRDVDMFVQACEKIGCHLVLDDFTMHHNSLRWLGSPALKFLKLEPKITTVAMKERVPQALVVAICQASKVLGLSCVAKRVDTPAVREWLAAVGIDYAQGFLLDQPRALTTLSR
jgi:EAL domain-containing protein (putative c-di-GMP-specific phosphodiesterase class I)